MKHIRLVSLITAVGLVLNTSGAATALDLFGDDETYRRNQAQLERNKEELARMRAELQFLKEQAWREERENNETLLARQRAELELLKKAQRRQYAVEEGHGSVKESPHYRQPSEGYQSTRQEQSQGEESSLSWLQWALFGLGSLAVLSTFSVGSGDGSAYTSGGSDSDSIPSIPTIGSHYEPYSRSSWEEVPRPDPSLGVCFWGDVLLGTCH